VYKLSLFSVILYFDSGYYITVFYVTLYNKYTMLYFCQQLHNGHSQFHKQLCLAVSKQGNLSVGDCFLTCKEKFLVHGDYCSNLLNAQELIDRLYQNSAIFRTRLKASQSFKIRNT